MTSIRYIHGIKGDEYLDRSKNLEKPAFIDYSNMSDGELSIALLREQFNILANFYSDIPDYQKVRTALDNALKKGIHYAPGLNRISGVDESLAFVSKALNRARFRTTPAGKAFPQKKNFRTGIGQLIPDIECDINSFPGHFNQRVKLWQECLDQRKHINILNKNLGDSSHHLLYSYITKPATRPGGVQAKRVLHNNAISGIHNITDLGLTNLKAWIRNGIMNSNVKHGTAPHQPEITNDLFANHFSGNEQIGAPPAAAAIISAIASAIAAIGGLIAFLKQQEQLTLKATAQGIGNTSFGPEGGDYEGFGGGQNGNSGNSNGFDLGLDLRGDILPIGLILFAVANSN